MSEPKDKKINKIRQTQSDVTEIDLLELCREFAKHIVAYYSASFYSAERREHFQNL